MLYDQQANIYSHSIFIIIFNLRLLQGVQVQRMQPKSSFLKSQNNLPKAKSFSAFQIMLKFGKTYRR